MRFNKITYKWQLKKRPYSDEEAKDLLNEVISPQTSDLHYNKHHAGYGAGLNTIEEGLQSADLGKANGNYSQCGELKRRITWNHGGALLHDVCWENLGGNGDRSGGPEIVKAIEEKFASFEAWKKDFKATAFSAKLSGWGVLVYDQLFSKRLLNIPVDEHHYGAIWGGIPIIACGVFEHAYYQKDGPGRATYIDNFIDNLHWERINKHFVEFQK